MKIGLLRKKEKYFDIHARFNSIRDQTNTIFLVVGKLIAIIKTFWYLLSFTSGTWFA
jgi:hypothetical protein